MNQNPEHKFSVEKRQAHTYEASVKNASIANDAVMKAQNWFLIICLAQLSFLGSILVSVSTLAETTELFVKILMVLFLVTFILFVTSSLSQFRHMVSRARFYEGISDTAISKYISIGVTELDAEPDELALDDGQIKSDLVTNYMFTASLLSGLCATAGVITLIFLI
jgi:hypothetical protein